MGGSAALFKNISMASLLGGPLVATNAAASRTFPAAPAPISAPSAAPAAPISAPSDPPAIPGARGAASIQNASSVAPSRAPTTGSLLGMGEDGKSTPGRVSDGQGGYRNPTPEEAYMSRTGRELPGSSGTGSTNKEKLANVGKIADQNSERIKLEAEKNGIHAKQVRQDELKKRVARRGKASTYLFSGEAPSSTVFRTSLI